MITREKIALLIETPSLSQLLGGVIENLGQLAHVIESEIAAMATGVPMQTSSPGQRSTLDDITENVDRLVSQTEKFETMFQKEKINGIEDLRTKVFPLIVEYNVIQLLKVREAKEISSIHSTLAQLREKGVAAVWQKILPGVTMHTRKICGLIFPQEYIDEGQTLPLDLDYLTALVKKETTITPTATGTSTTESRRAAPTSIYLGLSRGFLNRSSSRPVENSPKPSDTEASLNSQGPK